MGRGCQLVGWKEFLKGWFPRRDCGVDISLKLVEFMITVTVTTWVDIVGEVRVGGQDLNS